MGILLCEQNFRDVWRRNKSVRAEIGQILHTHTHTHTRATKFVVEIVVEIFVNYQLQALWHGLPKCIAFCNFFFHNILYTFLAV